jgi:hypothetical protein
MSVDDLEPGEVESGSNVSIAVREEGEDMRHLLRSEICDLHPNNPHHLFVVSRIMQTRLLEFDHSRDTENANKHCYLLSLSSDTSWSLGFISASDLLYACRLPLDNAVDIASRLLQIGIPFRTLARLPRNWEQPKIGTYKDLLNLPTQMEIPYRGKDYSFGATDYALYERQRQMLVSQRHVRASCLVGGIVWRLGRDLFREEEVLSGPTETVTVFGEGVFYRDVARGDLWCDDALTVHEMDLICGVHCVATGMCSLSSVVAYLLI